MGTKFLTGLFRSARKKLQLTHDNDMGAFREKLNAIVEQKDSISDEELKSKIDELKSMIADLPDSEGKSQLDRFLEDFANVKNQDSNVAKEASKQVADLFEKLDTSAMQDTPENVELDTNEIVENAKEEESDETKDDDAPAEKKDSETEDDDPNPNYSLEEIYQFIKKRMSEDSDAPAEDEACEESDETTDEGEEVEEAENEEVVEDEDEDSDEEKTAEEIAQDHAPRIAIRMTKDNAHRGGLYEMFEKIKRGER